MRYMFLIYSRETEEELSPEELEGLRNGHRSVMTESAQRGALCSYDKLHPSTTATTVRIYDGKAITTDGPFAETKEQLAGYYILECKDLDEAIEWARRIPTECQGAPGGIEIRPIVELPKSG
ncbi:MAG: YciI family protein [Blastocatellia bacterium]|nr:YciI family protein [Blastocatellia bacterium]